MGAAHHGVNASVGAEGVASGARRVEGGCHWHGLADAWSGTWGSLTLHGLLLASTHCYAKTPNDSFPCSPSNDVTTPVDSITR